MAIPKRTQERVAIEVVKTLDDLGGHIQTQADQIRAGRVSTLDLHRWGESVGRTLQRLQDYDAANRAFFDSWAADAAPWAPAVLDAALADLPTIVSRIQSFIDNNYRVPDDTVNPEPIRGQVVGMPIPLDTREAAATQLEDLLSG